MEWKLIASEATEQDPHGMTALLSRIEREIGGEALTGFTFLQDAREMLAFSRRIERTTLLSDQRAPLYVGFQTAAKLEGETERYGHLIEHGATTYGFGTGDPSPQFIDDVTTWSSLAENHDLLENQWFLVTRSPEPIAFVGWEVSPDGLWATGGVTSPGKQFAGFVSDDTRVVDAIIAYLEGVRGGRARGPASNVSDHLGAKIPVRTMIIVDDGRRPGLRRAVEAACSGAFGSSKIYLYDMSAASYLVNPYPNNAEEWRRPQSAHSMRFALGRAYLADMLDELAAHNIEAEAVLPEHVGFKHLAELSDSLHIDVLVVPEEFTAPPLIDRLRGNSLAALGHPRARIVMEAEVRQPVREAVAAAS